LPDVGSLEDAYDDDDAMGDDTANILAFDGEQEQPVVVEEDEGNGTDQNIVGGTPTNGQRDAPFFVRGEYGCGATLIAPDVVLGAAHCAGAFPVDSKCVSEGVRHVGRLTRIFIF
jgi:Trypsin